MLQQQQTEAAPQLHRILDGLLAAQQRRPRQSTGKRLEELSRVLWGIGFLLIVTLVGLSLNLADNEARSIVLLILVFALLFFFFVAATVAWANSENQRRERTSQRTFSSLHHDLLVLLRDTHQRFSVADLLRVGRVLHEVPPDGALVLGVLDERLIAALGQATSSELNTLSTDDLEFLRGQVRRPGTSDGMLIVGLLALAESHDRDVQPFAKGLARTHANVRVREAAEEYLKRWE